jgi:thiamine kinase-like enzyme
VAIGRRPGRCRAMLAGLHERWEGKALSEWPSLAQTDVSDLVERLFSEIWVSGRDRSDLTSQVRNLGDDLVEQVQALEQRPEASGPHTLVHGDASARNMRTSPAGEVTLLDWEDMGAGRGVCDLAWFLVSSVEPHSWDRTIAAYGSASRLSEALPAGLVQGPSHSLIKRKEAVTRGSGARASQKPGRCVASASRRGGEPLVPPLRQ